MAKKDNDLMAAAAGTTNRMGQIMATGASNRGKQSELTAAEKAEREATGRTSGRKGCHCPRITMVFNTENYHFLKTMAKIKGVPLAQFTNDIIGQYREEHAEQYNQLQAILKEMEGE